jgi:transposase
MYNGGMPGAKGLLVMEEGDRSECERVVRSRRTAVSIARRAQMLVLAASGLSNRQIALELEVNAHVVGRVRKEYGRQGLAVLEDRPRSGRPRSSRDEQSIKKVVETVCQAPTKGLSRWSARTLAKQLNIPSATVNRILRENQLQPHRLRTFTFSPDPQFGEKLLEVVALYMKPPDNAVVLCVDEKTGIQALDRTQPMLPLRAAKPRSWTNEYVRHGTRTLLASLDIASGRVIAHVRKRRTSKDFLAFLDSVVKEYPDQRLYVVLDNLNTHTNEAARKWLEAHRLVSFHYTPTHASWVNLIECFFSILTRQGLQQAVHQSAKELEQFLKTFIEVYNERCGPFEWTKGPEKLRRIIELTEQWQSQ